MIKRVFTNKSKLIGKKVFIKDLVECWAGHWGYIVDYDGDSYHVSGGSIATEKGEECTPIFSRNEFKISKKGDRINVLPSM